LSATIPLSDWVLEKNKDGVKVYTRSIEGWSIKEFKGVVSIQATLAQVEAAIRDSPNRSKWMHNSYDTKDVRWVSNNEVYTYSAIDAPWPVSDRDNVLHWKYNRVSDKFIRIDMKAAPNEIAQVSGVVRVTRLEGFWTLEDKGNGYIEVVQQVAAEPGGSIPAWLANSSVVDAPYNTLYNLKKHVESQNGILIRN
jgi:hypothetical protein